jgi:hypothetical protein
MVTAIITVGAVAEGIMAAGDTIAIDFLGLEEAVG